MTATNPLSSFGTAALNAATGPSQRSLPALRPTSDPAAADRAAREFEGMMIGQMLQPMFKSLKTGGMFGGGHAEETFRDLLVDEYGKKVAEAGGLGIAAMVRREILKAQEAARS